MTSAEFQITPFSLDLNLHVHVCLCRIHKHPKAEGVKIIEGEGQGSSTRFSLGSIFFLSQMGRGVEQNYKSFVDCKYTVGRPNRYNIWLISNLAYICVQPQISLYYTWEYFETDFQNENHLELICWGFYIILCPTRKKKTKENYWLQTFCRNLGGLNQILQATSWGTILKSVINPFNKHHHNNKAITKKIHDLF